MTKLEKWLLFLCSGLAPLATLRVGHVNLGAFDVAVLGLLVVQTLRRGTLPSLGWVYGAGALVIIGGLGSALFATRPVFALEQVLQWGFVLCVVVPAISQGGRDPSGAPWVFAGVTAGMLFLVAYSVVEVLSGQGTYIAGRYTGFHGSPQLLAFTVSSFLPYVVIGPTILDARRSSLAIVRNVGFLALAMSLFWLITMTASRTGIIASVAAVGVVVGLMEWEALGGGLAKFLTRSLHIASYVLVLSAGLVAILVVVTPEFIEVLARRFRLSVDVSPSVTGSRMRIYEEALGQLDVSTLLFGVGLENYPFQSEYTLRPHNLILLAVSEGGIVFVSGLLSMFGLLFRKILVGMRAWWSYGVTHRRVAAGATAGFTAFLIIAMFNTQSIHRMYWFNYAYAFGALSAVRSRD